jgi:predicted nucleic acid-binding protein
MRHIFVDTNVLIDFLADRQPHSEFAAGIFNLSDLNKIKIYVSAISFNNIYYILRGTSSHSKALKLIEELEDIVEIIDLNRKTINQAIKSSFKDFEDAIQYYSAISKENIEFIVTRNLKDFKNSDLPVFSSESAYKILIE